MPEYVVAFTSLNCTVDAVCLTITKDYRYKLTVLLFLSTELIAERSQQSPSSSAGKM
jgi:hypothetical protein